MANSKLLLLFVHGLGGNSKTWSSFKRLVVQDLDVGPAVDVALYEFPTKFVRIGWWNSLSMQDLATALRTEIRQRYSSYSRILLVCHSMGGLIAKRCVVDMLVDKESPIVGAVFFATPHSGAALASVLNLLSYKHRHLGQLRRESEFLDSLSRDWANHGVEQRLVATYVVAGQDAVVDRASAAGPGASPLLIADKDHRSVVQPANENDMSFLIVKNAASRFIKDGISDLEAVREARESGDTQALVALLANRGRSWIETHQVGEVLTVLRSVVDCSDPSSLEVIWSRYLLLIARLFLYQENGDSLIDDRLVQIAEPHGLAPLFLAEQMEFARKRGDHDAALAAMQTLSVVLKRIGAAKTSGAAYACGTGHFLVANLLRWGGRYAEARSEIDVARSYYRPPLLSHQIELAHCRYASAVCRAMLGEKTAQPADDLTVGAEFRRFAEALLTLTRSHELWLLRRTGDAIEEAGRAALLFEQISFVNYAARARSLAGLLETWERLELGSPVEKAVLLSPEHATVVRGMLGDADAQAALVQWIARARPSRVVGMLQFSKAFGEHWNEPLPIFTLPPVLVANGDGFRWETMRADSLCEADRVLREHMGVPTWIAVPIIAD